MDRRHGLRPSVAPSAAAIPELVAATADDAVRRRAEAAQRSLARKQHLVAAAQTMRRRNERRQLRRMVAACFDRWCRYPVVAAYERRQEARWRTIDRGVLRMKERRRLDRLWDGFGALARHAAAMQEARERDLAAYHRRRRHEVEAKAARFVRRKVLTRGFDAWVLHHRREQDLQHVTARTETRAQRMAALCQKLDARVDARRSAWRTAQRHHARALFGRVFERLRAWLHWRRLQWRKAAWHADLVTQQAVTAAWRRWADTHRRQRCLSKGFRAQRLLRRVWAAWQAQCDRRMTLQAAASARHRATTTRRVLLRWCRHAKRRAFIRAAAFRFALRRSVRPCFFALALAVRQTAVAAHKAAKWRRVTLLRRTYAVWDAWADARLAARFKFALHRRRRRLLVVWQSWQSFWAQRRRRRSAALRYVTMRDEERRRAVLRSAVLAWRDALPALRDEREALQWQAETLARVQSWLPPSC